MLQTFIRSMHMMIREFASGALICSYLVDCQDSPARSHTCSKLVFNSAVHVALPEFTAERRRSGCRKAAPVLAAAMGQTDGPTPGQCQQVTYTHTHTHTHPFNSPFSGTTLVSRYQKGKNNLDFTEARDSEWQWHQLGHMQVCTLLQTDNHTSTPPLSFLQAGCPFCRPTNSVRALKVQQ